MKCPIIPSCRRNSFTQRMSINTLTFTETIHPCLILFRAHFFYGSCFTTRPHLTCMKYIHSDKQYEDKITHPSTLLARTALPATQDSICRCQQSFFASRFRNHIAALIKDCSFYLLLLNVGLKRDCVEVLLGLSKSDSRA